MDEFGTNHESRDGTPQRSAITLSGLGQLFVAPADFFHATDLQRGWLWLAAAWLVGVEAVFDRIDRSLMKLDLGSSQDITVALVKDWPGLWLTALLGGVVAGAVLWFVGGIWFRLRLGWAGATLPDPREARLVYTFAGLVSAVPAVLFAVYYTLRFPNYLAAWQSEDALSGALGIVPLAFVFWSYVVSYRGVRARFEVNLWPARVWFLILPVAATLVVNGLFGALYAYD
jgi:hypothetical protein